MIINNTIQSIAGTYNVQRAHSSASRRTESVSQAGEVLLSREGKSFAATFRKIKGGADRIRKGKVDDLGNQTTDGTNSVSNEEIANALLATRY